MLREIPSHITKLRVLVVDDEPMLRSVIVDFLDLLGIEQHFIAGDGEEALGVLRSEPIDCVLSDIRMPKMELDQLLPLVRREFPRLIVIATSGCSDFDSVFSIFNVGAHDFLAKPLNLDALEVALSWVVERRRILDEARQSFGASAALNASEAGLNELDRTLEQVTHHFTPMFQHARRLGRLASRIDHGLNHSPVPLLPLAAYLHECGASHQMYMLCQQPRRLDPQELRLVQLHSCIAGLLVSQALERPELEPIIRDQPLWESLDREHWERAEDGLRYAFWLGMLNAVDGWLQDRPDRAAISLQQLREMLQRRLKNNTVEPLRRLLDQWAVVEETYKPRA